MLFRPVMAAWFLLLGLLGLAEVVRQPFVMLALSPSYAIGLCLEYKALAFIVLGSVVLCVTGAEALYTDMGHFGAAPISTNQDNVDLLCSALPRLKLFRSGSADHKRSGRSDEPFLSTRARLATVANGDSCNPGHCHCEPGGDFRSLISDLLTQHSPKMSGSWADQGAQ